jgi:hypothetical protein
MLSENDAFQLSKMSHEFVDNTVSIRNLKQSVKLKENIQSFLRIKQEHPDVSKEELEPYILKECHYLFYEHLELYNLLFKKDMDLTIMMKLLDVLTDIEEEKCNQHEGSVKVGTLLKEMYIDCKLSETKQRDELYQTKQVAPITISWKEYKNNM